METCSRAGLAWNAVVANAPMEITAAVTATQVSTVQPVRSISGRCRSALAQCRSSQLPRVASVRYKDPELNDLKEPVIGTSSETGCTHAELAQLNVVAMPVHPVR